MKFMFSAMWITFAALLLAGCATPRARIKQHQALFDSFPPEVQELVRSGKIDIGFDKDMVFIALGKPDREYTRTTAEGVRQVWAYTGEYTTTRHERLDGTFRVRDRHGQIHTVRDSIWADVPVRHEFETLRVEFEDGLVTAFEELRR